MEENLPQDVHTTDTVHDPYSGMIAPANLGANPNVYDPQYECFAWLGVSGLTNLGQVPGMGVGTTFTIRFEIMTEILFRLPSFSMSWVKFPLLLCLLPILTSLLPVKIFPAKFTTPTTLLKLQTQNLLKV